MDYRKELLYQKIARDIEAQILSGTLKLGDKLPSVRALKNVYKVSINTVKQAFLTLEAESMIESKPRTGFYVSKTSQRRLDLPSVGRLQAGNQEAQPLDLIDKVFNTLKDRSITQFSLGVPAPSMLPIATLNKGIVNVLKRLPDGGTAYDAPQGSLALRRTLAKWSLDNGGPYTEDDFVITTGAMNAIYNCLLAVTKPGDTIAIETPVYFGTIQIAQSLGLKVLEIPSHPITGIDLSALEKVLTKINVCCFTTNFSNPMGSLMPEESKKKLVEMLTEANIPLIEDDLYGNLYFGKERPKPCKYFDKEGIVMWCSSVSKTLAPGYRVGWVVAGKFKEKIIRQKLLQMISTPVLYQEVVADFMEHGRFDFHLRTLRNTLRYNCRHYQDAIADYFPANTKISQPQGGFVLWLELDERLDTEKIFDKAIKYNISFAPGRMFTLEDRYTNCMRLNYALEWSDKLRFDLKILGQLVKDEVNALNKGSEFG
ncbi:PLP-dependent aminotransferase family protein [Sphingobacterium sp. Mn56C]|uniref:aminotransferase-like domain-containing protein n=1 Tax=Sphingobacterium sp. Mn56C TaxID=3395261 RepID=UPI003BD3CC6F